MSLIANAEKSRPTPPSPDGTAGRKRFLPPAPAQREQFMSSLEMLFVVRRNALEVWNKAHFTKKSVSRRNLLGDVVVIADPAAIRHVLVDNVANYRKDKLQRRVLGADQGRGESLLTAEGDLWRRTRRTVAPLFTPKRVAGFLPQMHVAAARLAKSWQKKPEFYPIDAALDMTRVTFDVLASTLFSNSIDNRNDQFGNAMSRFLEASGRIDPLDLLGAPSWIPRIGRLQARASQSFFQRRVAEIIGTRREMLAQGAAPPDDLLSALLQAADPESGQGLSDLEVAANIITFIGAGHETTANSLTWSLYLISQSPDIQAGLEAELAPIDVAALDAQSVLERLPLTRAVIEEAMRLYPPAANLSREAIDADCAAGIDIPAKATVFIPPYVLHRHELLWEEPGYFRPERFMPGRRDAIERFAYLPFGAGPRICVGAQFALLEAVTVLATLLKSVRLEFAGNAPPQPIQRITLRPKGGMPMRIRHLNY